MKCTLSQVRKPYLIYYLSRNYQVNLVSIKLIEVFWVTIINRKKLTCVQTLVHFTFRIKTMMNRRPHLIWCKVPFSPFFFAVTFWNTHKKLYRSMDFGIWQCVCVCKYPCFLMKMFNSNNMHILLAYDTSYTKWAHLFGNFLMECIIFMEFVVFFFSLFEQKW